MFANRYTALVDACTLVSAPRRDLLLTLAEAEFFRVRWSQQILDETGAALDKIFAERGFEDASARATRSVDAMHRAFPEALVEAHASVAALKFGLPDANDEHVLAAAVQTQAQAVVTENINDFPASILAPLNIESRTADEFIADTIALDEGKAVAAIRTLRIRLKRPEMSAEDYLRSLEAHGLFITASILSGHAESI
ncbi:PIN domain-containing protein [Novosphingobium sp. ES2-1]|uniref:PIN domain-containing protein n=1 Tax=Novosphingobium sp. ES2-1 TaxID=2780074 RepID=UPI00187E5247|nr:PIN domain-containing protein [Novosphingobium sp. ES2-1]QOV96510.1 PIN domain-containing protein [Novosphingobium sp. ES2-1]